MADKKTTPTKKATTRKTTSKKTTAKKADAPKRKTTTKKATTTKTNTKASNALPQGAGHGLPEGKGPGLPGKPITRAQRVKAVTGKDVTTIKEVQNKLVKKNDNLKMSNQKSKNDTPNKWREIAKTWVYGALPLAAGVAGTAIMALGFGVSNWTAAIPAALGIAWMGWRVYKG